VKVDEERPFQPQHLLALVLFLVGGGILYYLWRGEQRFLVGFAVLFLAVHLIAVTADTLSGKVKSLRTFIRRYLAYSLQTVVQLLALVMFIPMILVDLVSGPMVFLGIGVSLGGMAIYFVEQVIGYDIRGYSFGEKDELSFVIVLFIASVVVLGLRVMLERHKPQDKVLDLILHGLDPLIDFSKEMEDNT
jgi:hypothetical protein